jgi:unsaturated rhamnogalacturonyl hydrolase
MQRSMSSILGKTIISIFLWAGLSGCSSFSIKKENSPEVIGRKVINDFLSRQGLKMYHTESLNTVHYAEACAGMGAVRFATLVRDTALLGQLESRYTSLFNHFDTLPANHVDANVIGILPLAFYQWDKKNEYLKMGIAMADKQWENPQTDGLTNQTRYWIDDIFMIGSLQVEAFKSTVDTIYLDRATKEIRVYLEKLQHLNGLFFHGPDAPFFWGRGNGWVAAGMAELLSVLPESNPDYQYIINSYRRMMKSLLQFQTSTGMWRQLIDREEAWEESSCTAMFGYAMSVGVKMRFLTKRKYKQATKKAWLALVDHLAGNGKLKNICEGTGQCNDAGYYLKRQKITGDLHGQAPLLWFACSLIEKNIN